MTKISLKIYNRDRIVKFDQFYIVIRMPFLKNAAQQSLYASF